MFQPSFPLAYGNIQAGSPLCSHASNYTEMLVHVDSQLQQSFDLLVVKDLHSHTSIAWEGKGTARDIGAISQTFTNISSPHESQHARPLYKLQGLLS